MYNYNVQIVKVIDGDTLDLCIDLGFHIKLNERVRLANINCPETSTPEGITAKAFVLNLISPYQTYKMISLREPQTDKYGRWLAIIVFDNGVSLNDLLVKHGHAVPYMVGK